ncbi:hypothetical protein F183_A29440 [Bryobacterales bacterium F-183]|nr:hypothetical protein F183_A29440 [Bryobacterales bacterium F-183]
MLVKPANHRFVLKGFVQERGGRTFLFEGIDADNARTEVSVHADMSLLRTHGIPIQELPLLCLSLLERRSSDPTSASVHEFGEQEMSQVSADRSAAKLAAAQKRKPFRRPTTTENTGVGWRTTSPLAIRTQPQE